MFLFYIFVMITSHLTKMRKTLYSLHFLNKAQDYEELKNVNNLIVYKMF